MKNFIFLILFCACSNIKNSSILEEIIKVNVNETFNIKLGASMGTGFSWVLKDTSFLKNIVIDSTYSIPSTNSKEGAPETQVFRFKTFAAGECKLHFIYKRPWEKDEANPKEKIYIVTIR